MTTMYPPVKSQSYKRTPQRYKVESHYFRYWVSVVSIVLTFTVVGCTGDRGSREVTDFQLNLNLPEVVGEEVTINGGVAAPVERIQWEWGDGQVDHHQFFPASHNYDKPGRYEIKVTVFDSKNRTATKSVTVEIK